MNRPSTENGGDDRRMLPVALILWISCLVSHDLFVRIHARRPAGTSAAGERSDTVLRMAAKDAFIGDALRTGMVVGSIALACVVVLLLSSIALLRRHRSMWRRISVWFGAWGMMLGVCAFAASSGLLSSLASDGAQWHDPAWSLAREHAAQVEITAVIRTPGTTSDIRQAACQSDISIRSLTYRSLTVPSGARARMFVSEAMCSRLERGSMVKASGVLRQARFGPTPLWVVGARTDAVTVRRPPHPIRRAVHAMQSSFFRATDRLSDQGRVLVPGLTVGVLGQEIVGERTREPVDDTYAILLERRFSHSGIMHLMAVSGGHFVLVAGMVKRALSRMHASRRICSIAVAGAQIALAGAMYPSDSVVRALVTGLLNASALFVGRRPQPLSALCWSVIMVLLVAPGMSRSLGFALSCSAVLGIVLCSAMIRSRLPLFIPRPLAAVVSATCAAQLFTAPLQALIDDGLPLASVPANMVVAPFVGCATVAGLVALLVSPLSEQAGFVACWIASCGTAVMKWCADLFGSGHVLPVPMAGSPGGMVIVVAMQAAAIAPVIVVSRIRRRQPIATLSGERHHPSPLSRIAAGQALWWRETLDVFARPWGRL